MTEDFLKRGYNFSRELLEEWEKFHAPSKDYSPSAAAAFLIYMVLEPALREKLRKLAFQKNIKQARIEARKELRQTIIDAYFTGFVGIHSEEDRALLLKNFIKTEKIRILSPEESAEVKKIKEELGPEPMETKSKKAKNA